MDYPEMVSCRMTSGDLDRLTASAQRAGMARSEYLRTLIRVPASASGKGAVYVIDNRTMAKMLSEAEGKLEEVEQGRQVIEYVLADIAGSTSVSGD